MGYGGRKARHRAKYRGLRPLQGGKECGAPVLLQACWGGGKAAPRVSLVPAEPPNPPCRTSRACCWLINPASGQLPPDHDHQADIPTPRAPIEAAASPSFCLSSRPVCFAWWRTPRLVRESKRGGASRVAYSNRQRRSTGRRTRNQRASFPWGGPEKRRFDAASPLPPRRCRLAAAVSPLPSRRCRLAAAVSPLLSHRSRLAASCRRLVRCRPVRSTEASTARRPFCSPRRVSSRPFVLIGGRPRV